MLISVRLSGVPDHLLDEVNRWYSTVHVMEFLQAPGIVSVRRFVTITPDGYEFLALYEHDESCQLDDTFASGPAQRARRDMISRWSKYFERPPIEVFHPVEVGEEYRNWRPDAGESGSLGQKSERSDRRAGSSDDLEGAHDEDEVG